MENKENNSVTEEESNVQNVFVSSEQVDLGIQENVHDDQVNTFSDTSGVQPMMKWNWGPLVLPFWWCLFSYCYWHMLLLLIPPVNVVWRFVLAGKGNEWSWKTGKWKDAEYFNKTQKTWNKAGAIFLIIVLILIVIFVISDLFRVRY